jgi:hypothetical protein
MNQERCKAGRVLPFAPNPKEDGQEGLRNAKRRPVRSGAASRIIIGPDPNISWQNDRDVIILDLRERNLRAIGTVG